MPQEITDGYWHGQFQRVNREVAQTDRAEMVFFGDSITWHWSLGNATGQEIWTKKLSRHKPINMGNSGDITPVMLYRLTHGNLDFPAGQQPKVAVLLCGTNNFVVKQSDGGKVRWDLGADCPPQDVAAGARAIAQVFRRRLPQTRVIMMGILPVSNQTKWHKCQQVNAINAALSDDNDALVYLDLQDKFLQPDGSIEKRLFTDGTHLTAEGYRVWAESIDPVVSKMMKAGALEPMKIMLIGDSITEGACSSASYRRYLDGMLRRDGNLIDFVGGREKHKDNQVEPDSYEYDVDHEGHWGKDSGWLAENMPALLKGDAPDVAIIHMGSEDIVAGTSAAAVTDGIIGNIGRVVATLRAKNRNMRIILAKIIPLRGKPEEVESLNRKISQFAAANATPKSPLLVADLHTAFSASDNLADDGVLPNQSGAKKMARTLADAIGRMLAGVE
ncbi:MAG: acyl-CoA thioesterase-1 [Verrucomicrobiales bacterium]|jgi:acyl-CoA thioesterase-1